MYGVKVNTPIRGRPTRDDDDDDGDGDFDSEVDRRCEKLGYVMDRNKS